MWPSTGENPPTLTSVVGELGWLDWAHGDGLLDATELWTPPSLSADIAKVLGSKELLML